MGPTNVALVKLFRADQALREAQERLDAASKNVRVQERRVNDLTEKLKVAQTTLREAQSRAKQLELDQGSRDAHIEKLRSQQSVAKNHKEYQAFLIEINTQKVDRAKIEEEQLKVEESLDKSRAEVAALTAQSEAERAKLTTMKEQIGETLASHHAEVDSLLPARAAAAEAIPVRLRETFERLAEHHDGEAMSAISKPDRRKEEYLCTACNMELARDVYNKLHSRDEIIYCPSCRRILYIPDDLPPEEAIGTGRPAPKAAKAPTLRKVRTARKKTASANAASGPDAADAGVASEAAPDEVVIEPRAKGKLGEALSRAQGETVQTPSPPRRTPSNARSTWTASWPASTRPSHRTSWNGRSSSTCRRPTWKGQSRSRRWQRRGWPSPKKQCRHPRLRPPSKPATQAARQPGRSNRRILPRFPTRRRICSAPQTLLEGADSAHAESVSKA